MEAVRYFSDLDTCNLYLIRIKWPDGKPSCPKCGECNVGYIATRRMMQCKAKGCRKQFSAKVGTIFEDSPLGLDKWFVAVWCIANDKNGISSCEVARALGVTQKTAWFLLHRVRMAMRTEGFQKISGEVESDESFIGGKASNMHPGKRKVQGRGTVGKAIVHGILERGSGKSSSRVKVKVVPNQKRQTLQSEIKESVEPGSTVYTDTLASYEGLDADYVHEMINHAIEYVRGRVHTNGIENFWSLLKRCLGGTYVSVAPWHLDRYLDEEAFRFNERKETDAIRFLLVMQAVVGKRLMYKELIGRQS